jgi:5-methylcytosine-specific restriction protein B
MREAGFRVWLGKRLWKGEPLTKKATANRVRRSQRAERGLQGPGFPYETLDQLFDDGKWDKAAIPARKVKRRLSEAADIRG